MTPAAASHHLAQAIRDRRAMTPEQRAAEVAKIKDERDEMHRAFAQPGAELKGNEK